MPSRVIDGDALWTSKKLKQVDEKYRGEYANLIPLASPDGTFDPDPDLIHRTVYAYNRPNITVSDVAEMMVQFEKAGMIAYGHVGEKRWATFVGIEKEGRLPPPSRRNGRNLPPEPSEYIDVDRPVKELEHPKIYQKGLPYLKLIPKMCRSIIGIKAEPEEWYKKELKELAETYGGTEVVTAFEEWAKSLNSTPKNPVREFLRVADGFLQNKIVPESPALDALCVSLYNIGGQVFTGKYRQMLNKLLSEFSFLEIEKAYKVFTNAKDEYELKFVVRDFCEGGCKTVILSTRDKERELANKQELIEQKIVEEQTATQAFLDTLEEPEMDI